VSRLRSAVSPAIRIALLGIAALAAAVVCAGAQETVNVSVPMAVNFAVTDVTRSTSGAPSPVTISFSNSSLINGRALRISVQADAASFTPPSGSSIPASRVSWTSAGAHGGLGMNGILSSTSYAMVFQSNPATPSGYVDLAWTMAAPGSGIRAGVHQLTIRWKFESITP
jgi:hypothetical protein